MQVFKPSQIQRNKERFLKTQARTSALALHPHVGNDNMLVVQQ